MQLAQQQLLKRTSDVLSFVNGLPISPQLKCHALNLQLRAHLSFLLSHHSVSSTWISSNLDNMVTGRVRHWLELPPSATAHFFPLPAKWLGLDLILPSMLSVACRLGTDLTLIHSSDPKMAVLHTLSREGLPYNKFVHLANREMAARASKEDQVAKQLQKLDKLNVQSVLFRALRCSIPLAELVGWSRRISVITPSVLRFARKALIRCLPTNSNLHVWGRLASNTCPNCGNPETEKHVLNNCSTAAVQGRYTWRHKAVLRLSSAGHIARLK